MQHPTTITITRKDTKKLISDGARSAEMLSLVYVSDKENGIRRVRKGDSFIYKINNVPLKDATVLARIKSLVLPPAWQEVWICASEQGHLQATGIDANGRKQYRYHHLWVAMRNHTKFLHLHDFGMNLPKVREQIKADLALPGLCQRKVLAAVVALMDGTGIRIGGSLYEKLYGSFGLTTMKDKHVAIEGDKITFGFKGKKGVQQNVTLKSKKLARIVKQCRDIPGKELFQYYDEQGNRKSIDSGMVNSYIKEIGGDDFSAKDFRTWTGTVAALEALLQFESCETQAETNKRMIEALDLAAQRLGNTRTVCRKYYVHPAVMDSFVDKSLQKIAGHVVKFTSTEDAFSIEEQVLMKILYKAKTVTIELAKTG